MRTLQNYVPRTQPQPERAVVTDATLNAILERLDTLNRNFDEFARVYLNAKFPHGRATDRWARRW
jgi:hypothetical protein